MWYNTAGTPSGGVISPLLSNICRRPLVRHEVLDRWFAETVQPLMKGKSFMVRYADGAITGCGLKEDTGRIMKAAALQFAKYGLTSDPWSATPGDTADEAPAFPGCSLGLAGVIFNAVRSFTCGKPAPKPAGGFDPGRLNIALPPGKDGLEKVQVSYTMSFYRLPAFLLCFQVFHQKINLPEYIILQGIIQLLEIRRKLFQARIDGLIEHGPRAGFKPLRTDIVGYGNQFDDEIIYPAPVRLNFTQICPAQFEVIGEFFLCIPKGFPRLNNPPVYLFIPIQLIPFLKY